MYVSLNVHVRLHICINQNWFEPYNVITFMYIHVHHMLWSLSGMIDMDRDSYKNVISLQNLSQLL